MYVLLQRASQSGDDDAMKNLEKKNFKREKTRNEEGTQ
jgi:hypothetical protein